jgi:zinc transporter ZupT
LPTHIAYPLLLFIITLAGGSIPLLFKGLNDKRMHLLLAFSGSFLLSITFMHLLPETFGELGSNAGLYLLIGFFLQLLLQRITHGLEHGHVHTHTNDHGHTHVPLFSILLGISIHAIMEGLPLGFNYRMHATEPSLYMAVAVHKLPEAMLIASLVSSTQSKQKAFITLVLFSLVTPFAGILAYQLGIGYSTMSRLVMVLIPIVAGAFIHIATTIFFESGTKHHMLTWQKVIAIVGGMTLGFITLLFE